MVHGRPRYNSAISTFCWAIANDEEYWVNDRSTVLEVLYIDDLVEGMFDLLEGKEQYCEYNECDTVPNPNGRFCYVPGTHKVTLGEIVDLLGSPRDSTGITANGSYSQSLLVMGLSRSGKLIRMRWLSLKSAVIKSRLSI
jgi:nucleoside-diphosphate-sugar epimerase